MAVLAVKSVEDYIKLIKLVTEHCSSGKRVARHDATSALTDKSIAFIGDIYSTFNDAGKEHIWVYKDFVCQLRDGVEEKLAKAGINRHAINYAGGYFFCFEYRNIAIVGYAGYSETSETEGAL